MAVISRIRAWRNPGFTEGGPKAPRDGHSLPTPDYDLSLEVHPSADRMFSEFRLLANQDDWVNVCYLELTFEWNNLQTSSVYYGWADSADCISDSDSAPVVAVKWHIDEWGTWIHNATLGYGHILRRPVSGSEPIQGYTPRYWTVSGTSEAVPLATHSHVGGGSGKVWWALVAYGANASNSTEKIVYYACWPFDDSPTVPGIYGKSGNTTGRFIGPDETFQGRWDEMLGVAPDAIYGAWLLPCPPLGYGFSGSGNSSDPYILSPGVLWEFKSKSGSPATNGNFYGTSGVNGWTGNYSKLFPIIETLTYSTTPTERNPIRVLGFDGASVLDLPLNFSVSRYEYRVIASATECYIGLRFDGTNSKAEGVEATIPALTLDLTENAWSSYVYSGQRQYDKDARYNESMKKGIESVTSGVVTGALLGGIGPAGAAVGAATGGLGGAVGAAVEFGWYNEASQEAKDKMMTKQSPGIIISGSPWDAVYYGTTIRFARMAMDNYTSNCITNERNRIGVKVNEYAADNSSVKTATGFYQIVNLEVNGSIPNSAKRYIANRFAQGVILI